MAYLTDTELTYKVTDSSFLSRLETLSRLTKKLFRYRPRVIKAKTQSGFEFLEYRPYLPGDDLRNVDWNVYRRFQEMVIKEYAVETPHHWLICLDTSLSMQPYRKFLFARQLAAGLMYVPLSLLDKVSAFSFPQKQTEAFHYHSKRQTRQMLHNLDQIKTAPPNPAFSFRYMASSFTSNAKAIIISDFYDKAYQEFFPLMKLQDISVVAVHIVAKEEINPPFHGEVVLEDAESGNRQKMRITSATLDDYKRVFQTHLAKVKSFCNSHQASYIQTMPGTTWDKTVLEILKLAGI